MNKIRSKKKKNFRGKLKGDFLYYDIKAKKSQKKIICK